MSIIVLKEESSIKQLKRKDLIRRIKKYKLLYIFALPAFFLLLLFSYGPLYGLVMAFQAYNPIDAFGQSPWVGFDNFKELFKQPNFGLAVKNTLIISTLKLVFGFPAPIILALLLNELRRMTYKKTLQTLMYIPNFVSWVVAASVFYTLLSSGGVVNDILKYFGLIDKSILFMQKKEFFYPILIFQDIWKGAGYGTIFFIAAIATIPMEQYEAAQCDGAGRLKQAWYITLPSIKGTISILFILSVSGILNAGFDQIYTMKNLAVTQQAMIIDTYILNVVQTGMPADYSMVAAFGLLKSIISIILFGIANFVAVKLDQESVV